MIKTTFGKVGKRVDFELAVALDYIFLGRVKLRARLGETALVLLSETPYKLDRSESGLRVGNW